MDKESWGFFLAIITIGLSLVLWKLNWHWSWKRTRGTPPMYGQIWTSPGGKTLYVLKLHTEPGELGPSVIFTDQRPSDRPVPHFRWSIKEWKKSVDDERLVLTGSF